MNIHWPKIELPDGFETEESYLRHLVEEGAKNKYGGIDTLISVRIEHELHALKGFEPYILIIHHIVEVCKANDIFVTAIHKNAACSIVNYCLGITVADPIRWGLLFERFRAETDTSFPCIELFVNLHQSKTFMYHLKEEFGWGYVTKAYDRFRQKENTFTQATSTRIPVTCPNLVFLFDEPFEKALGTIQAEDDCTSEMVDVPKYSKDILEELGYVYVHFDYIIDISDALLKEVEHDTGMKIIPEDIPLDDKETFDNLTKDTPVGSFYWTWKKLLRETKEKYEIGIWDLCNILTIHYRSFASLYIERKKNEKSVMDNSVVSPILRNTLGMLLYKEQIYEILLTVAGMDYKEAGKTRCALLSHDDKRIDASVETIMERCLERGLKKKDVFHILNLIMANMHTTSSFSHIICYALLFYREAWLRVHFPESYQKMKEERKRKAIDEDDELLYFI